MPGGAETLGLCRGADGLIYVLQRSNPNFVVIRLDNQGHLQAWPTGGLKLPVAVANANGLAELAGNLYVTSRDGGVYRLPVATGSWSWRSRPFSRFIRWRTGSASCCG